MKNIKKFNEFQEINEGWKSNILASLFMISSLISSPNKTSAQTPTQIESKFKNDVKDLSQIASGNAKIDDLSDRVSDMSLFEISENKSEILSEIKEIALELGFEDIVSLIDENKDILHNSLEEDEALLKMNEIVLDIKSIPDVQKGELSYLAGLLIVIVLVAMGAFTNNFPNGPRRRR